MEIRLSSNNNNCMHIFKVFKILKWTLQNFLSKLLKISFLDISNNLVIHERVRVGLTDNKYECTRCRLGYLVNIELQVLKPHKVRWFAKDSSWTNPIWPPFSDISSKTMYEKHHQKQQNPFIFDLGAAEF